MFRDKEHWHADGALRYGNGRGNGDENLREQALFTLLTVREHGEGVGQTAKEALMRLYGHYAEKSSSKAFALLKKHLPQGNLSE